jgi:hypothetical protein
MLSAHTHTYTHTLKYLTTANEVVWKENHIRRWLHVLEPFKCSTCVDVYEMSGIALRRRLSKLLVPLQFRGSHESHSQFGLNANHLDELSVPYGLSITTSRHDGPMSFHRIYISKSRVWDPQLTALILDSQPFGNTWFSFKVVVD